MVGSTRSMRQPPRERPMPRHPFGDGVDQTASHVRRDLRTAPPASSTPALGRSRPATRWSRVEGEEPVVVDEDRALDHHTVSHLAPARVIVLLFGLTARPADSEDRPAHEAQQMVDLFVEYRFGDLAGGHGSGQRGTEPG